MNGKTRALQWSGASGLALGAAMMVAPSTALACQAFAGTNPVVTVLCGSPDNDTTVDPFTTAYRTSDDTVIGDTVIGSIEIYNGDGSDLLNMGDGGSILNSGATTPRVNGTPYFLDPSDGFIDMLGGDDEVIISGGQIGEANSAVSLGLGAGNDSFEMLGGVMYGSVIGASGNDAFNLGGGVMNGTIFANDGNDTVVVSDGATVGTNPTGAGDAIGLDVGDDVFTMSGGTLNGDASGNEGNDRLTLTAGQVNGDLLGNEGNDTIGMSGGVVAEEIRGNDGNDQIAVSAGSVQQNVSGDEGTDNVDISGGTIQGDVEGETVTLTGGTIFGNISGITANTLTIQNAGTLNLRDGVLIAGTGNAVGIIRNTDLAQGGVEDQVFSGFATLSAFGSTLGFAGPNIGIAQLSLSDGSTLFVNNAVNMTGTLSLTNSLLTMLDGAADDTFTLGGLTLNASEIRVDVDQQTSQADRLVAGVFNATGTNTIVVNLLGTPQFAQATDIVIIDAGNGVPGGTFNIVTIPGTAGSLFTYEILAGANGGLILRASPGNLGVVGAPQSAIDNSTVNTAIEALYGVVDDAIEADLQLGNGSKVPVSGSFGVFASGQLAHTEHDGFSISNGTISGAGPEFKADDFSAAISLDFNAAKHFGFEEQYGLNLGLFAGYAATDVSLGGIQGFPDVGEASNDSGMFGGYALARQGTNYALVAVSAFLGNTDVANGVLNASGDYDTEGYAATGSVGHIFALNERLRFDLRGGLLGVTFRGDGYTDSGGNVFGDSRVSFGALKFEPGIYADYQLENGMVFSPYARADLQQRFGYENTTQVSDVELEFDDADFSAAMSGGFNLRMSQRATLSGEVRGKLSEDSSTIGGKLGFKVAF